jgi:hypothetical protein
MAASAAFSLAFAFGSPAEAKPVTVSDLAGRKFCWNDGGTEIYSANGKYLSTHDGHGTWRVIAGGVDIRTNQITGVADMQRLDDGSFTSTWIVEGKPKTWTGRYCD